MDGVDEVESIERCDELEVAGVVNKDEDDANIGDVDLDEVLVPVAIEAMVGVGVDLPFTGILREDRGDRGAEGALED